MEYKSLRPSQTLLDPQNPRLPDGTSNDREAINRLLAEGYNQLLALARDLVDRGETNPTELPIVMKDGTKYVVLEGNRRFAALKLLGDPRLADDVSHQAAFDRVEKKGKQPPKSLYCAVAKDRAEADPWITLRHTGANDGVGVRVWSAEQNARHRRRMKAPIDSGTVRSIAIADELTEAYQADTELVDLIKKVRAERLTNVGRFFSGVTLTRMQFVMKQVSDGGSQTFWAKHTADQLRAYFVWAFKFLDNNSVDAFKNDTLRGKLLNDHSDVLPDAADSMADHRRLADQPFSPNTADTDDDDRENEPADDDRDGADPTADSSSDPSSDDGKGPHGSESSGYTDSSSSGRKRDKQAERCLYSEVKLPNLSPNIQRLLREAKQLPIDENYATACVLARVILELAVSDPKVSKWSGKAESDTLANKIEGCIVKLDPLIDSSKKRSRQDLVQAHLETKEIGVTYLHQFMHNPSAKSDPHLARRFSTAFAPLLNSINEAVK
ncbi:MAG: hypothetical protein ACYDAQ_01265 [Mycobacteriales bacterium]